MAVSFRCEQGETGGRWAEAEEDREVVAREPGHAATGPDPWIVGDVPQDEETTAELSLELLDLEAIPAPAKVVPRRFPRFPTPRLPGSLAQPADSVVLDLSRHGACLETLYRLEEGRHYGVQIGDEEGAQAVIEVRWCRLARVFRDEAGALRRVYRAGGPFVRVLGTGHTGLLGSLQPDPGLERSGADS